MKELNENLADVVNEFTNLAQDENESMFAQGVVLANAVIEGLDPKAVKRECGMVTGKSARTMSQRLAVGLVFGDDFYVDCDWSIHMISATAPGVDLKKPETFAISRKLMDTAIAGYTDDKGNHRPHTARTLKALIAGDPKPKAETVISQREMTITRVDFMESTITLKSDEFDISEWVNIEHIEGETVTVTITRKQLPSQQEAAA